MVMIVIWLTLYRCMLCMIWKKKEKKLRYIVWHFQCIEFTVTIFIVLLYCTLQPEYNSEMYRVFDHFIFYTINQTGNSLHTAEASNGSMKTIRV